MELKKIFLIKLISTVSFYFFNVTSRIFTLHIWLSLYFYWTEVLQICFLQTTSSLLALVLMVLPCPQDLCTCCFYPFLIFSHLTLTHLSAVCSSLISSMKTFLMPLCWFNSPIICFHITMKLTFVAFVTGAILPLCTYQISIPQPNSQFHENRQHIYFCSPFFPQCFQHSVWLGLKRLIKHKSRSKNVRLQQTGELCI